MSSSNIYDTIDRYSDALKIRIAFKVLMSQREGEREREGERRDFTDCVGRCDSPVSTTQPGQPRNMFRIPAKVKGFYSSPNHSDGALESV
jgi:hypothetical protein